jgi:dipeptidyl-peptidase 4
MSIKALLLATSVLVMPLQLAVAADAPQTVQVAQTDIAARYAASDDYVSGKNAALIIDLNMQATFVKSGVLFRRGAVGAGHIVLADPAKASETELVAEADLLPKLTAAGAVFKGPATIRPADYDAEKSTLKLSAGGKDWVCDLKAGTVAVAPASPERSRGVASPDGKQTIISRNFNLYAVDQATGKETALTSDGSFDKRYGTNYPLFGDMAHANSQNPEMPVAAQWSPDGKSVLTYRLLRNDSYIWHGVQPSPPGSQFPREFTYVYPTAGAKQVPKFQPILINVATGTVTELKVPALDMLWPGDPSLYWEGDHILYDWTERGYRNLMLFEIDPATGVARVRVHEGGEPLVTVTSTAIRPASELKGDLIISERSGWAQLYYIAKGDNPAGGKALTKGNWEVTEITHIAEGGPILITGIGREPGVNPYFKSLYRVTLKGQITNLTPEPLDHETRVSEDGKWLIDRMSSPTVATRTVIRSAVDGKIAMELGRADASALLATGFTAPEPFETLSEDGKVKLYGVIYRPKNFDPGHSYPVIENVYTGPTTHRFDEDFGGNMLASTNAIAQIGAIVVTIDGRGTSQRGKAFRAPAYQNLGEVGLDDHIWVLKQMKAKYSYFDLDRVGVYGGSAGGYDTARFLLRRPDFYKVGVASSGNHDLRLDKAWWPEVSMGLADDATWEANSNVSVAKNLKGKLMLIHGDIDDNVPVAASLRLSKALIDAGKPHELVILPNTTHAVYQPYYWKKLRDYFTLNLLGETPPQ